MNYRLQNLLILSCGVLIMGTTNYTNLTLLQNVTNSTEFEVELNNTVFNNTDINTFNLTEINTTDLVATTEMDEETTTQSNDANIWTKYSTLQHSAEMPCVCDLLPATCDVNCCCDKLCSKEDQKVFTSCGMPLLQPDLHYCYQENFIFINNTPYTMVLTSNDLFCIKTDNYQERLYYNDVQVITNESEFEQVAEKYLQFSWPEPTENVLAIPSELKVGTPVFVQYDDESLGYLELPRSLTTGECISSNPTGYMINADYTCHQLLEDLKFDCLNNIWLDSRTYFKGFKIVSNPESLKNGSFSTEDLIEVSAELCLNIFGMDAACNSTDDSDFPLPYYDASSKTCNNAVSRVKYEITHNGTEGIYSATVRITLGAAESLISSPVKWMQKHGVDFQWASVNASSETAIRWSGNPGYQVGAKILAGKLVSHNAGDGHTKDVRLGISLSQDDGNWLTVLGASPFTKGHCIDPIEGSAAGYGRISVAFGRDMKTGCLMTILAQNLTDMCSVLQNSAMDALLGWDSATMVGAYGNANVSNPGEWVPILVHKKPSASHPVDGVLCTNIVRELRITILHASIGSLANPQSKIVGVQYVFEMPGELKLRCVGRYCQDDADRLSQSFSVSTSVTFVDVSEKAVPVYSEPPSFHVQLPNDFFYPFVSFTPQLKSSRLLSVITATYFLLVVRTNV